MFTFIMVRMTLWNGRDVTQEFSHLLPIKGKDLLQVPLYFEKKEGKWKEHELEGKLLIEKRQRDKVSRHIIAVAVVVCPGTEPRQ